MEDQWRGKSPTLPPQAPPKEGLGEALPREHFKIDSGYQSFCNKTIDYINCEINVFQN